MRFKSAWGACLVFFSLTAFASQEAGEPLRDPDPKIREKYARTLGEEGDPANISVLASAVQDADGKVRMAVVKSLIHLGTPASLVPLSKAVQDGYPEIRLLAIDGMVNLYLPGYIDTGFGGFFRTIGNKVENLFSDVDTAVIAGDVQPDPDLIRTLAVTVNGAPDTATRVRAARALGVLRAQGAVQDLLKAAFSNNVEIINEVLRAFQKIKDPSVGPRIGFLLNYPQKSVQQEASSTLGLLRSESAIPDLLKLFENSDDKDVRAAVLEALAYMPQKETASLFVKYLSDKEKRLRASSALGLGRLMEPNHLDALQNSEEDEKDAGVRLALDFALINKGKMELLRELVSNLTSRVHRGEARPYLVELAREQAVREALRPYLSSKDAEIRKNLCVVYGASGDSASISYLDPLVRDRDAEVSNEAGRAIRLIHARGF